MTIRAVIVDDEPLARRRIRNLLAEAEDVRSYRPTLHRLMGKEG